jgi:TP901 family phage tail tape measure protein
MADVEELRILLTTQAQTNGATQTREALRQVRSAANEANQGTAALSSGFKVNATDAIRFVGALTGVQVGLSLFAAAGRTANDVLQAVIETSAKFGTAMAGVGAVSGASAAQLARLSELARTSGQDLGVGAIEGAKGLQELVKGGVSTEAALGGALRATELLAKAGGVDLATAAEISATALNSFGLSAAQLAHVADLVAGAANASSIGVDDFRQSLSQAGAVARTIGVTFDDTAVAIAELGQAGIKGSDAGTSLRTFLLSLTPASAQAGDELRRLGIITRDNRNQFFDAAGQAKSLSDVSQILKNSLAGATDQQKLASLQIIFGTDALRAASIFAREGSAGFDSLAASMAKVSASDVAKAQVNSLGGDLDKLKAAVEGASISLEKTFDPQLRNTAKQATETAKGIDALFQALDKGIPAVPKVAAPAPVPSEGLPLRPTAPLVFPPKPLPSPLTDAKALPAFALPPSLPPLVATTTVATHELGQAFSLTNETLKTSHSSFVQIAADIAAVQTKVGTLSTILGALGPGDVAASASVSVQRDIELINARADALHSAAEAQRLLNQEQEATKILDPRDAAGANAAKAVVDAAKQLLPLEQAVADAKRQQADISGAIALSQGTEAAMLLTILPQHQEIARLEREKLSVVDKGLQLRQEETRLLAQQAALGPQNALDDTQAKIQRDKLIAGDRGQSIEDRTAARREARDLTRTVLPGQELSAFDATRRVTLAQRAENQTGLNGQIGTNKIDQQIDVISRSIKGTEDVVFALNQNTESLTLLGRVADAVTAVAQRAINLVVNPVINIGGGANGDGSFDTTSIIEQATGALAAALHTAISQAEGGAPPSLTGAH